MQLYIDSVRTVTDNTVKDTYFFAMLYKKGKIPQFYFLNPNINLLTQGYIKERIDNLFYFLNNRNCANLFEYKKFIKKHTLFNIQDLKQIILDYNSLVWYHTNPNVGVTYLPFITPDNLTTHYKNYKNLNLNIVGEEDNRFRITTNNLRFNNDILNMHNVNYLDLHIYWELKKDTIKEHSYIKKIINL